MTGRDRLAAVLAPDVLHGLFEQAVADYWDASTFERVVARERDELAELKRIRRDAA